MHASTSSLGHSRYAGRAHRAEAVASRQAAAPAVDPRGTSFGMDTTFSWLSSARLGLLVGRRVSSYCCGRCAPSSSFDERRRPGHHRRPRRPPRTGLPPRGRGNGRPGQRRRGRARQRSSARAASPRPRSPPSSERALGEPRPHPVQHLRFPAAMFSAVVVLLHMLFRWTASSSRQGPSSVSSTTSTGPPAAAVSVWKARPASLGELFELLLDHRLRLHRLGHHRGRIADRRGDRLRVRLLRRPTRRPTSSTRSARRQLARGETIQAQNVCSSRPRSLRSATESRCSATTMCGDAHTVATS